MTAAIDQPAKEVFEDRWRRVQDAMGEEGFDALIVASRGTIGAYGNVVYLTGYTPLLRASFAVLRPTGEPILFVPSRSDVANATGRGIVSDVRTSAEMDIARGPLGAAAMVAEELSETTGRIGVVGLGQLLSVADHGVLTRELPDAELVDASGMYAAIKQTKTAADVEHVRAAFGLAQQAYDAAPALIAAGVPAQDVVAELERILRVGGGSETLVFVDSAPQWVRRSTDSVFADGDLIMVLVEVASVAGYFVEMGGLVSVGEPGAAARTVSDACYEALGAIGAAIRPGASVAAAAELHAEIGRAAGLQLGLSIGHGIGVDHDLPTLHQSDQSTFSPGQLISVHPYYWHPDQPIFGGVGDAFYVTDGGSERMGAHDYELVVV